MWLDLGEGVDPQAQMAKPRLKGGRARQGWVGDQAEQVLLVTMTQQTVLQNTCSDL